MAVNHIYLFLEKILRNIPFVFGSLVSEKAALFISLANWGDLSYFSVSCVPNMMFRNFLKKVK